MSDQQNPQKSPLDTFEFTIAKASGVQVEDTWDKSFVKVEIGGQEYRTKLVDKGEQLAFNESFNFNINEAQNIQAKIKISLYLRDASGKDVLHGQLIEPLLDLNPNDEELTTKTITGSKPDSLVTITYRVKKTTPRCSVFALVIGIDEYASNELMNLSGCVNDARSMFGFLVDRLHVPNSNIVFLTDTSATRQAIISNFEEHLLYNKDIREGDTIVFFYAGHGSRLVAPTDLPSPDGKIEAICPHNTFVPLQDSQDGCIYPIPDYTINRLLRELADAKGDNITVIFDCCHSGGIARQASSTVTMTSRCVETRRCMPVGLDSAIHARAARAGAPIPIRFKHEYMSSHVLLAACRQEQSAWEDTSADGQPCGFFTNNLIIYLNQVDLNRSTYAYLLNLLPEQIDQHPQCEGKNKDRILFNAKAAGGNPRAFGVTTAKDGKIIVKAGSMCGVVVGTEFAVQDPEAAPSTRKDLGILVAASVSMDESISTPLDDFQVPDGAKAVVSDWKNETFTLRVFVQSGFGPELTHALFPETVAGITQPDQVEKLIKRSYVQAASRANAHVVLSLNDNSELVVDRKDPTVGGYAEVTISHKVKDLTDNLPFIVDAIAHFNRHLDHRNKEPSLRTEVSLELHRLKNGTAQFGARVPDDSIGDLLAGNHARIVRDANALYGLTIINRSDQNLFPYLFYFDPSDYTIQDWYLPPAAKMAAPLHHADKTGPTKLTIGYGAGGGDPFEFTLGPNQTTDTGFLKLFVSTKYVNMEWLSQSDPFDPSAKRSMKRKVQVTDCWDALFAAVTVYIDKTPESGSG